MFSEKQNTFYKMTHIFLLLLRLERDTSNYKLREKKFFSQKYILFF